MLAHLLYLIVAFSLMSLPAMSFPKTSTIFQWQRHAGPENPLLDSSEWLTPTSHSNSVYTKTVWKWKWMQEKAKWLFLCKLKCRDLNSALCKMFTEVPQLALFA